MLSVAASVENARKIYRLGKKYNLNIDPQINNILDNIPRVQCIPGFAFKLKDFQADGVAWLESQLGTGLLADEQGTGKTVQVMAYAHKNKKFPMAVVCPNTLKFNWRNEILAMTGSQYSINIVGKSYSKRQIKKRLEKHPNITYSKTPVPGCNIYVLNYECLSTNVNTLGHMKLSFMAVDESQKIKNPLAKRTKAFIKLATGEEDVKDSRGKYTTNVVGDRINSVVLMSGTPMVSRPKELWTTVRSIGNWLPEFSNWSKFAFRYCNANHNGYGWDFNGSSNETELHQLLTNNIMIRRLKADVLKELPPKLYKTIPLEFDRDEYDKVEQAFNGINWAAGMQTIIKMGGNAPKSDDAIVAIQKLREIAGYSKLQSTIEWIKDYTEDGEKIVVFAHNRLVIDTINSSLQSDPDYKNCVGLIYGGVSDEERADAVLAFQTDPNIKVIIVGITSGGFGLTLTAAKAVAFIQLPWTPGEISQCVDRIHRIGQDADIITVYNLVAEGTIEEDIAELLIAKGMVLDSVLDNGRIVNTLPLS